MKWLVMVWLVGGPVVIDMPPAQTAASCRAMADEGWGGRMAVVSHDGAIWIVAGAACLERDDEMAGAPGEMAGVR